jgi:protoporphyrinogen oxidase
VQELHREMKATGQPIVSRVDYWEDADPLPPHLPEFAEKMSALKSLLLPGMGLAGSDYDGFEFAKRIMAGQRAAQQVGAYLQS